MLRQFLPSFTRPVSKQSPSTSATASHEVVTWLLHPTHLLSIVASLSLLVQVRMLWTYRKAQRRYEQCIRNDPTSKWHICRGHLFDAINEHESASGSHRVDNDHSTHPVVFTMQVWGASSPISRSIPHSVTCINQMPSMVPLHDMSLLANLTLPKQVQYVQVGKRRLCMYPPFVEFCVDPQIRTSEKRVLLQAFQQYQETIPRALDRYNNAWRPLQLLLWEGRVNDVVTAVYINERRVRTFQSIDKAEYVNNDDVDIRQAIDDQFQDSNSLVAKQSEVMHMSVFSRSICDGGSESERLEDKGIWLLGQDSLVHQRLQRHFGCASGHVIASLVAGTLLSVACMVSIFARTQRKSSTV